MFKKENVTYILRHENGFYVKNSAGALELIDDKKNARQFPVNNIKSNSDFVKLTRTGQYKIEKRTETVTVEFKEVESV
ncbi:hypothetical protein [Salinicoccus sp. YB14-2]|uniref:hypothetical protein n=1 Tax=Salinicoccus sp. YB14-2 TaxID=1572701 RepID=UPI00068F7BE2|nr:hypothetical protein [Salinicoccus sp. YB14-2]